MHKLRLCRRCGKPFARPGPNVSYCGADCRFMARVEVAAADECWLWTGKRDRDGYGRFTLDGSGPETTAHRYAFQMVFGPVGRPLVVCHRCDNPPCVNPAHLFAGTVAENNRDRDRKGRGSWHNSAKGERQHSAKLTAEQVATIRREAAVGVPDRVLAERFGVHHVNIRAIRKRTLWKHVA